VQGSAAWLGLTRNGVVRQVIDGGRIRPESRDRRSLPGRRAMLRPMPELASAVGAVQVIGSIGSPVVALAAIGASVWTTSRTLGESRDSRLWSHRAEVYVDLVRLVRDERSADVEQTLMAIGTLDAEPEVFWQSGRDRDHHAWDDREVRILTYASDRTRELYHAWDHALLRLAGVVQPPRVTGAERPADIRAAVTQATGEVIVTGDQLLAQIRSELQSGRGRRRRIRWIPSGRSAS
jgi:hypothetical protein